MSTKTEAELSTATHRCLIQIDNQTSAEFTLNSSSADHGSYGTPPPSTIAGNTTVSFELDADAGFYGAEGGCVYAVTSGVLLSLTYGDPVASDNHGSVNLTGSGYRVTWQGKASDSSWQVGSVPTSGNPVSMQITVVAD